ncbi:hypothetical protein HRED_08101 [Candidatus Haloredivivus sp. G17]|nr:hypothetical protein HRED_08101 [Candidatus Haloredivivus sp. G17]
MFFQSTTLFFSNISETLIAASCKSSSSTLLVLASNVEWSNERETIGLKINSEKEINVKSPISLEKDEIEEALEEKSPGF